MQVWQTNSSMWWDAVQTAVSDAEAENCSLMLTLFWNTFAFPDIANEPLPSIANETSSTWTLMSRYIKEMVKAVGESKAIVAWEVTNELNLLMDLDMEGRKTGIAPSRGTPTERTRADNISTAVGVQFGKNVVSLLAQLDPHHRPVSAGYSMPRASAFHLMQSYPTGKQDFTLDTQDQFEEVLRIIHEPFEIASAHLYARPGPNGNVRFNTTPVGPYDTTFLGIFNKAIRGMGKQPLLGEFGDPLPGRRPWANAVLSSLGPVGDEQPTGGPSAGFAGVRDAAMMREPPNRCGITTALVWCWEFYQHSATVPANYSLVFNRSGDEATLQMMFVTNLRLRGQSNQNSEHGER